MWSRKEQVGRLVTGCENRKPKDSLHARPPDRVNTVPLPMPTKQPGCSDLAAREAHYFQTALVMSLPDSLKGSSSQSDKIPTLDNLDDIKGERLSRSVFARLRPQARR
mmetsp:Transcript_59118/g.129825  ORF Transcript_59118/g.129825 Transcript_59118/m.129825 type:complete len:108 (-) Transcript_59118:862-1185(-)